MALDRVQPADVRLGTFKVWRATKKSTAQPSTLFHYRVLPSFRRLLNLTLVLNQQTIQCIIGFLLGLLDFTGFYWG